MAYTPDNNPYVPGDPYSYDLKWQVANIKHLQTRFAELDENIQEATDQADRAEQEADRAANRADFATEEADRASVEADRAVDEGHEEVLKAEGYATGTQEGTPVTSGSPYYQNNSKYYSEQAASSADEAEDYAVHIADPVSGLVSTWLAEHITQPTTPAIDTSLRVSGAAADSKTVGDKLGMFYPVTGSGAGSNIYCDAYGTYNTGDVIMVIPTYCSEPMNQIYIYGFSGNTNTRLASLTPSYTYQKPISITLTASYDRIRVAYNVNNISGAGTAAALVVIDSDNTFSGAYYEYMLDKYKLSMLNINCLGDSLTYGYNPDGPSPMVPAWPDQIAADLHCIVRNYGVTNNAVANNTGGSGQPMCIRYADMDDNADVIIFMGGTNDFLRAPAPIGTIDSLNNTTFYGALNVLAQGLLAKYYNKRSRIIWMVPPFRNRSTEVNAEGTTLQMIQQAVRDVAKKYSFPVIDWAADAGISPYLIDHDPDHLYTYDGIHITQAWILSAVVPMIEKKIAEVITSSTSSI